MPDTSDCYHRRMARLDTASRCRWCGQPLSALARVRGDVCDAMDCRRHAVDARAGARRDAHLVRLRAAAARADDAPALANAPVLWLRRHAAIVEAPLETELEALRAYLMALEADAPDEPAFAPDDPPAPAIAGALCTLCRGRCCRHGLRGKGFIEARQLRAWLAQRPQAGWRDAVDHWMGFVAAEHLAESCLFHATTGCTLPRERRSEVCNSFACDALAQACDGATAAPDAEVLVGIVAPEAGDETLVAARLSARGSRPLPEPPAADQPP